MMLRIHPGGCDSVSSVSLFHCFGCSNREPSSHSWHVARFDGTLKSQDEWSDSALLFPPVFSGAISFRRWNIKLCIMTLLVVAEPRVVPGRLGLMALWKRRKSTSASWQMKEFLLLGWHMWLCLCGLTETRRSGNYQSRNIDPRRRR